MKKIINNIIYNGMYQFFLILTPIITIPYVSRILGANKLGENSFIISITTILSIFIFAGMNQYGVREIAKTDTGSLKQKFFDLWKNQLFMGLLVICLYVLSVFFIIGKSKAVYYYIQIPLLLSYVIDVSWFFIGIGEIKKVIVRNTLVKIVCLGLIFYIVKNPSDLWKYMLINSISTLIANSFFWFYLQEYLKNDNSKINLKIKVSMQAILLVIPQLAAQFYTSFDKTLVGFISGNIELSYYDQSQKIARLMLTIITSMSVVLMPLMAVSDSEDNHKVNDILKISSDYTLFFATFCCGLLMVNAQEFVPWFFGSEFIGMTNNLYWVSLIIIPIAYGGVFSNQLALSKGLYKKYTLPYIVGAAISLGLNLLLIPQLASFGAIISLIVTELVVCLIRVWIVKDEFEGKYIFSNQKPFFFVFLMSTFLGLNLPKLFDNNFYMLVYRSIVYFLIYILMSYLFKIRMIRDLGFLFRVNKKSNNE